MTASRAGVSARRPVILLTGFGAFPGVPVNASWLLAERLADAAASRFPGYRPIARPLPTEWRAAPAALADLNGEHRPALALHFGVSSRANGFNIEARARNVCAPSIDACGELPAAACIAENGPDHVPASIPVRRIVERLRALGIAAEVSRDAGSYLCNALLYHALTADPATPRAARTGFVHIPTALIDAKPERAACERPACGLDWETAVSGGLEIIAIALGRPAVGVAPTASRVRR